jgi:hypothetical protein
VYLPSFNVFNLTLWDDIIAFGELTEEDVLVSLGFSTCHHLPQQSTGIHLPSMASGLALGVVAMYLMTELMLLVYSLANACNATKQDILLSIKSGVCPAVRAVILLG